MIALINDQALEYVVIAIPAAVALAFAGIVGFWVRSRRH